MKYTYLILILITLLSCQKTTIKSKKATTKSEVKEIIKKYHWLPFSKEKIKTISISKSEILKYKNLKFNIIWDNKLSHSDNIGYYGGIKQLTIYKNNKQINIFNNIEDGIALGTMRFKLYDYNLDGYLDFTIPIDCGGTCWSAYYLFNPKTNKYEHCKDWDYLRISKINKETKQIKDQPYGNDAVKTYQIKVLELIKIKQL